LGSADLAGVSPARPSENVIDLCDDVLGFIDELALAKRLGSETKRTKLNAANEIE
jgi:hypothetical protein